MLMVNNYANFQVNDMTFIEFLKKFSKQTNIKEYALHIAVPRFAAQPGLYNKASYNLPNTILLAVSKEHTSKQGFEDMLIKLVAAPDNLPAVLKLINNTYTNTLRVGNREHIWFFDSNLLTMSIDSLHDSNVQYDTYTEVMHMYADSYLSYFNS